MVEFILGMFVGLWLWPWWGLGIFGILFIADSILCDKDNAFFGTILMVLGMGLLVWLAGDHNPFALIWNNLAHILGFLILYFVMGAAWSMIKWRFFLASLVREAKQDFKRWDHKHVADFVRPDESYAKNNAGRIMGWIGHWPMSIVGTFLGDIMLRGLVNLCEWIYESLSKAYEGMGNQAFAGLEHEAEEARRSKLEAEAALADVQAMDEERQLDHAFGKDRQ